MSPDNKVDYHGKAEIIIAKHRKGATGIILVNFANEYTRFENPEDSMLGNRPPIDGGEIRGSSINGGNNPPEGFDITSIIPPPDDKPIIF